METRVSKAGVCGQFIRIPFGDPKEVWKIHDDGALQSSSVPKLYAADMRQPSVYLTKARALWGIGSRAATEAVPDHEWFTQEIIADGGYMTIRINWQASQGSIGKFTKHEEAYVGTAHRRTHRFATV